MPSLGSSAYEAGSQATAFARVLLRDGSIPGGTLLTDTSTYAIQYLNGAYQIIQDELQASGIDALKAEEFLVNLPIVTVPDPATIVQVNDSGTRIIDETGVNSSNYATPLLPPDLVYPIDCWERPNGTTQPFRPMKRIVGPLPTPSAAQQMTLGMWTWLNEGLTFIGATAAVDVRLRYDQFLQDLANVTDQEGLRRIRIPLGYLIAAMWTQARSSPGDTKAGEFNTLGMAAIDRIIAKDVRDKQRHNFRMKPYRGGRTRGRRMGW